jgi:hypothetical protein
MRRELVVVPVVDEEGEGSGVLAVVAPKVEAVEEDEAEDGGAGFAVVRSPSPRHIPCKGTDRFALCCNSTGCTMAGTPRATTREAGAEMGTERWGAMVGGVEAGES